jgi:dienelactone hydrolase
MTVRAKEKAMEKTVGTTDRAVRVLLAAGAVAGSGVLGFSSAGGIVLLVVAAIMVVTAASGYCPVYSLLGIKTTGTRTAGTAGGHERHLDQAA